MEETLDNGHLDTDVIERLEDSLEDLKDLVFQLSDKVEVLEQEVNGSPVAGLRRDFKCSTCNSKGMVAAKIICTACGKETIYGWLPQHFDPGALRL